MTNSKDILEKLLLDCLCEEYQSLWIINVSDQTMTAFKENHAKAIPGSIDTASQMNCYDQAREWYVANYVDEENRERVLSDSSIDNVLGKVKDGQPYVVEYRRVHDNQVNYNQLFFSKLSLEKDDCDYLLLGFREIDQNKKAELDELTGMYTRKDFIRHAEKVLAGRPDEEYDLLITDFVNFKDINEQYGAKIGDEILKGYAKNLLVIAKHGLVVGRYGGDQFAILIAHEAFEKALLDMDMDYKMFDIPALNGMPTPNVKFGICGHIKCGDSVLVACDRAHIAVNSIKHQYGVQVAVYDHALKDIVDKNNIIEKGMRQALEEKQFKVYYQPKHDTVTGKVVGAEALIRWEHPTYGFMSPGDFIPLFEKNGFIVETDHFVYRRTCENLRKWKDAGVPIVPISVNASKRTVEDKRMLDEIASALQKSEIPSEYLHVEITESLMSEDVEMLVRKLESFKEQDIQIELDDFGAGYSSINMLSSLPLDVIKLDMSFMKQFGNEKRAKVLEACVNLAKNLGYTTVSEGVETQEQLDSLRSLGVDIIQGFYYSRPLPEDVFSEYLIKNA